MEIIYKAFDGRLFDDEADCAYYENCRHIENIGNRIKVYYCGERITDFSDIEDVVKKYDAIHFDNCDVMEQWRDLCERYGYAAPNPDECDLNKPLDFYYENDNYWYFRQYSDKIAELEEELAACKKREKEMEEN